MQKPRSQVRKSHPRVKSLKRANQYSRTKTVKYKNCKKDTFTDIVGRLPEKSRNSFVDLQSQKDSTRIKNSFLKSAMLRIRISY